MLVNRLHYKVDISAKVNILYRFARSVAPRLFPGSCSVWNTYLRNPALSVDVFKLYFLFKKTFLIARYQHQRYKYSIPETLMPRGVKT